MPARVDSELAALVRRIQAEGLRDELADDLFRRLHRPLYALFARRPSLCRQAEDLVQDAMARIFAGIADFRFESRVESWAWQVARNVAANAQRDLLAGKRHADEVPLEVEGEAAAADRLASAEPSPHDRAEAGETRAELVRAVLELPDKMRRCWIFRVLHGFSERQTAAALGVSVGTVKSQVHEARKRLHARYPDRFDP